MATRDYRLKTPPDLLYSAHTYLGAMEQGPIPIPDDDQTTDDLGALVPFDPFGPTEPHSPAKRTKTGPGSSISNIDQGQLMRLIQNTIQESVASSIGSMHATVQTLVEKTCDQNDRLGKVEHTLESHHTLLTHLDFEHTRRLDVMQGELVQLQKVVASPKATPPPVSLTASGSSNEFASFDLVMGGWKEGAKREWVESQLSELLAHVGVKTCVSHIKLIGKRPTFAKLELNFGEGATPKMKRDHQLEVLSQLRRADRTLGDSNLWITTDKTPAQRKISRAIAVLNQFLFAQLKLDRGVLDVSSWVAAKSYVGDARVSDRMSEKVSENCK